MAVAAAGKRSSSDCNTNATTLRKKRTQTTLVSTEWHKKSPANNGRKTKSQGPTNGNILAFFKKAEDINNRIFLQERGANPTITLGGEEEHVGWSDEVNNRAGISRDSDDRYNETGGSDKRRRVDHHGEIPTVVRCAPPLAYMEHECIQAVTPPSVCGLPRKPPKKSGPFLDDSDSESDSVGSVSGRDIKPEQIPRGEPTDTGTENSEASRVFAESKDHYTNIAPKSENASLLQTHDDFSHDFDDVEDDDVLEGEEYDERRWMKAQMELEMEEANFEGDSEDFTWPAMFPRDVDAGTDDEGRLKEDVPSCPICRENLPGLSEQNVLLHVNACLDGSPQPPQTKLEIESPPTISSKVFKRKARPAKPGQADPFQIAGSSGEPKSAFSKLMAGHAEDAAWASAAAENNAARGKPAYQRTCPFYKILPGFFIAVDAFRYGAVAGQRAYFLSHFHSDHYIGLTASWAHGPIFCSKITGNLVRQQLRVEAKWVVDLDFEEKTEVPGTEGVFVTMISANHCPGSSLFLFEKQSTKGTSSRLQRVLHCGDFRACQAHVEHPLLRPDVLDVVSGKTRQQKLDVCYLDTTYLNPKYAFPPQQQVIQACADMCVSLNKIRADESDGWEQMKRERAGQGMVKFVRRNSSADDNEELKSPSRGRLLVIVGTYSIGKERICVGIAKALGSKIYAPANKQRICRALEDPELLSLLTSDPRAAQVHMTPLFEIRADTLDDYLRDYSDTFSRAVGFRPSGWNYRPPNSRFTESPSVQTILHSQNWKSAFSMKDLAPQRGSSSRASCFGVPYSEHSSFRELTMFCCALRIDKIIPTVNVGSAKSREKMKAWCERWMIDKKKNGLFDLSAEGGKW